MLLKTRLTLIWVFLALRGLDLPSSWDFTAVILFSHKICWLVLITFPKLTPLCKHCQLRVQNHCPFPDIYTMVIWNSRLPVVSAKAKWFQPFLPAGSSPTGNPKCGGTHSWWNEGKTASTAKLHFLFRYFLSARDRGGMKDWNILICDQATVYSRGADS